MGTTDCDTAVSDVEDLEKITARALRAHSLNKISLSLNPLKVIPTEEGLLRDWRGLAQLAGLDGNTTMSLSSKPDPTSEILKLWISNKSGDASIGALRGFFKEMDRWDVVDDTSSMFEQDAKEFSARLKNSDLSNRQVTVSSDKHILTVDDVCRIENGLQPQNYDAFLLFAEEDVDFAMQMVDKMENDYGLKLCIKDRDLVGGLTFEHEAIMKLIAERCSRLIVVVSPNFLKSEANKFFVTFAQALGIEQRQRKVVPCLYQRCQLPPELSYYFLLDFSRAGKLWNIWEKLRDSIQAPTLKSDNRLQLSESRLPMMQSAVPHVMHNESIHTPEGRQGFHLMDLQRGPPPPYTPSSVTPVATGHHSNDSCLTSTLAFCHSSNNRVGMVGQDNRHGTMSQSISESNLLKDIHVNGPDLVNQGHSSELDIPRQVEASGEKVKPFRWLRRLLPKEGKRKRHKRKAVCN